MENKIFIERGMKWSRQMETEMLSRLERLLLLSLVERRQGSSCRCSILRLAKFLKQPLNLTWKNRCPWTKIFLIFHPKQYDFLNVSFMLGFYWEIDGKIFPTPLFFRVQFDASLDEKHLQQYFYYCFRIKAIIRHRMGG
jgi:hypothetical protein